VVWGRLHSPFRVLSPRGRNKEEEEAEQIMVSTISFIQANVQHSIAASGVLTRTVGIRGIDMAEVQELGWCEDCIRVPNIPGYTFTLLEGRKNLEPVSLQGT